MKQEPGNEYVLNFSIDRLNLGIYLNLVIRVIRAVGVTPLPGAPGLVMGIVNIGKQIIPIINFRKRFLLKGKDPVPSDKIIIVKSSELVFGFFTDEIHGLKSIENQLVLKAEDLIPGTNELIEGIVVIDNEMILIHDVKKFLSIEQEKKIATAIKKKTQKKVVKK